ncbi:hypothetical protein MB02_15695 [Croceicoccus estronivorus]|uniref:DUF2332 domain-containing protein n=1 Tax=Croceicoccus estronivorus TaxID=1172626 RepID=UPI00082CDAD6|nr:DUF2332 domain-containing protein [Croceicoccus estronivorus]OCC22674.1 hypothetical protein MB02_15695 [Croceicoccus estronivorus]
MASKSDMQAQRDAISWQAEYCRRNDAPVTGRVVTALLAIMESDTLCGRRMASWQDVRRGEAMPLRLAGGFHSLHLSGAEPRLEPVYAGAVVEQSAVDAILLAVVRDHDEELSHWLDGPPQTNEAGRSAGIMAGLLWLVQRLGPRFELNEIGASAGTNTMMDRFAFDLGGVRTGDMGSPMRISPEWRGSPPPDVPVCITAIRGCDIAPIMLTDPQAVLRLKSYVWADATKRMERIDAAIALAAEQAPVVDRADAGEWVEKRLSEPQESGVTRVLFHSIVWQYLPPDTRKRIEGAMEDAGKSATAERPLAWVQLETNRESYRHELRARYWAGGSGQDSGWTLLGEAHAHGAWVAWFDGDDQG